MKRLVYLSVAVCALILTACHKNSYSSQVRFNVSDGIETKAILDAGTSIVTWEEGDVIEYRLEVVQGKDGNNEKVDGKLVYEQGSWATYVAQGSSFSKVEGIPVNSSSLESEIKMSFTCENGDSSSGNPNYFLTHWVQTVPFTEGRQTVLVKLQFKWKRPE